MKTILSFLWDRAREKSTWVVLATLGAGFAGIEMSPELKEEISTGMIAILGAIAALVNENKSK